MNQKKLSVLGVLFFTALFVPELAHADLVSSLTSVKLQLTGVILPLLAVIGICVSAISFFTGHPNSKQHIFYAILGCIFGFGAQAIVDFISGAVH